MMMTSLYPPPQFFNKKQSEENDEEKSGEESDSGSNHDEESDSGSNHGDKPVDYENKLKVYNQNDEKHSNSYLISLILKEIGKERARNCTLKQFESMVKEKLRYYIMLVNDCGKDEKLYNIYKAFRNIWETECSNASEGAILDEAIRRSWYVFRDQVRHQVGEWTYIDKYQVFEDDENEDSDSDSTTTAV